LCNTHLEGSLQLQLNSNSQKILHFCVIHLHTHTHTHTHRHTHTHTHTHTHPHTHTHTHTHISRQTLKKKQGRNITLFHFPQTVLNPHNWTYFSVVGAVECLTMGNTGLARYTVSA